jgi:dipeptidyl-peptidase-4
MIQRLSKVLFLFFFIIISIVSYSQEIRWTKDGNGYYRLEKHGVVQYTLPGQKTKIILAAAQLTPEGGTEALQIENFWFSDDESKALLFTNTRKVWRINTRGDYWVADLQKGTLTKLGKGLAESSLMFAKFSPDNSHVAYVSDYNIFTEDLASHTIKQLTSDGNRKFINGTFDWVYEEEFACRDGIRWSPDSRSLAYWQIDARDTRDFYMINYTDSVYSHIIPVEYPTTGQLPSACRIGVVDISTAKTKWMNIAGDPMQHYIVRLEYIPHTNNILVQQLNRKQNESRLIRCNTATASADVVHTDSDEAWVDVLSAVSSENVYRVDFAHRFNWLGNGKEFLWISEKDGWRHIYRESSDGKYETLITKGDFDVIDLESFDESTGAVYYTASPENATQKYLYKTSLDGRGNNEMVTASGLEGTHHYTVSPNAKFAFHTFTNANTPPVSEWISLPRHKPINARESIAEKISAAREQKTKEFFKVKTSDGVVMDGWMVKPENFDSSKKYPVVFYVYTEPWGAIVKDEYRVASNRLYQGDMRKDGYIYIGLDNRGTPAPKGRAWRKSIYRKIGQINIRDQAMAASEILKWPFVDPERIAVWGWSGGGSATLNLMFQYPEIYKTGIAVAAVTNLLTYDNIYQERYMGLPEENMEDYIKGSPLSYAKNLQGSLLYIHGTGDDNVHYSNAEMLLNELIRYNKQFQFMSYPNRTHSISQGEGTMDHLKTLYTTFLKKHCPPGPK